MMKLQLAQLDERWGDLPQIISKRLASTDAPLTTGGNGVSRVTLFNVAVQGLVLKEVKPTLPVIFESRTSLRSEPEVVWKHDKEFSSPINHIWLSP